MMELFGLVTMLYRNFRGTLNLRIIILIYVSVAVISGRVVLVFESVSQ